MTYYVIVHSVNEVIESEKRNQIHGKKRIENELFTRIRNCLISATEDNKISHRPHFQYYPNFIVFLLNKAR